MQQENIYLLFTLNSSLLLKIFNSPFFNYFTFLLRSVLSSQVDVIAIDSCVYVSSCSLTPFHYKIIMQKKKSKINDLLMAQPDLFTVLLFTMISFLFNISLNLRQLVKFLHHRSAKSLLVQNKIIGSVQRYSVFHLLEVALASLVETFSCLLANNTKQIYHQQLQRTKHTFPI